MAKFEPDHQPTTNAESVTDAAALDWPRILTDHDRWLRTVVRARLGEPQAVDEVMQEVALAAVRQKAPIQDTTKVSSWLYRLAVMQTLQYRRKQGRRRNLVDRYATRNQPREADNRTPNPLGSLLSQERHRQVREAMQSLAPRDAEILMLKYTEDWSYRELADRLGISESAVEARLHRARQRLRSELSSLNVNASDTP